MADFSCEKMACEAWSQFLYLLNKYNTIHKKDIKYQNFKMYKPKTSKNKSNLFFLKCTCSFNTLILFYFTYFLLEDALESRSNASAKRGGGRGGGKKHLIRYILEI